MKLAEEELLDIIPQSGTIVSRINLRHVEEGRFIREKIEKEIVALACEIFPEEFRFRLKPILRFRTYARETIISISCLSWTRSSIKFCLRVRAKNGPGRCATEHSFQPLAVASPVEGLQLGEYHLAHKINVSADR